MKRFFGSGGSAGFSRAEWPAELLGEPPASSSAKQPARNAAPPANDSRSVADVRSWIQTNAMTLGASAEAKRP